VATPWEGSGITAQKEMKQREGISTVLELDQLGKRLSS